DRQASHDGVGDDLTGEPGPSEIAGQRGSCPLAEANDEGTLQAELLLHARNDLRICKITHDFASNVSRGEVEEEVRQRGQRRDHDRGADEATQDEQKHDVLIPGPVPEAALAPRGLAPCQEVGRMFQRYGTALSSCSTASVPGAV